MTDSGSVSFKLFEPMMFRGPGEFDPYVRGTQSRAVSMIMPSPSTIAGAIATCIMAVKGSTPSTNNTVENWYQLYLEILGRDTVIRGPFLMVRETVYLPQRSKELQGFIQLSKLRDKCKNIYAAINSQDENKMKESLKPELDLKVENSSRVGIMLEKRLNFSTKHAREGFFYGVDFVDYGGEGRTSVQIVAEIHGTIVDELSQVNGIGVRLGGEGRVSFVTFTKNLTVTTKISEEVWNGKSSHNGLLGLYVASPPLFKGGRKVIDQVKDWCQQKDFTFRELVGQSDTQGAGFMLATNRRKPVYSTLTPGSIVFVEGEMEFEKFYLENTLGEAGQLGFGTIIPVQVE